MKLAYATLLAGMIGILPPTLQECGGTTDSDGDGTTDDQDCAPTDPNIHPGATETCDGVDQDCDGVVDDNAVDPTTYYQDADGDSFGNASSTMAACAVPTGYTTVAGDCDDTNAMAYPGAEELPGDAEDSNCNGHSDYIHTVAGTGTPGYSGDGGAATSAQLNSPFAAVQDLNGNIYLSDSSNHRVRKVDTAGKISTFAGTGTAGYSGDGGSATAANLNFPKGLAVDSSGVVYIADTVNQRVRRVDTAGKISTFAGTGVAGFSGDSGAATAAQLKYPYGLAIDANKNVYIADAENHRIRLVSGGTIRTVAGSGTAGYSGDGGSATAAQLNYPRAVALNATTGTFYVADSNNYRIRAVNKNGTISTVVGNGVDGYGGDGGAATAAKLNDPYGVAVDAAGNLFVADTDNNRVRMVDSAGLIWTVVGTGAAGYSGDGVEDGADLAKLNVVYSVSIDSKGNLLAADNKNAAIRQVIW